MKGTGTTCGQLVKGERDLNARAEVPMLRFALVEWRIAREVRGVSSESSL